MFITGVILAIVGILWLIFAPSIQSTNMDRETGDYKRVSLKPFGFIPIVLAMIAIILSLFTIVGTRQIGVETSFNKPTGRIMGAGLHMKVPWTKVTEIDGAIQYTEYFGDSCIQVKIADGGRACLAFSYRWRINPDAADVVFQDYRNSELEINDAVRSALVSGNIKASANEAVSDFDPLGDIVITSEMTVDEIAELDINVNLPYAETNKEIEDAFNEKIASAGGQVELISVTISGFSLPEATQRRIDAFNAQTNETKIAVASIATKKAQADANKELEQSVDNPNVLVSKCLDGLIDGDFSNQPGFSCWPGSNGSVVIPSAR